MTWAFWLSRIYEKPSKGKSGDLHLSYGSVMAYFNSLVALADAKVNPKSDRVRLQGELGGGQVAAGRQGPNAQAHFPALHHEKHPHGHER